MLTINKCCKNDMLPKNLVLRPIKCIAVYLLLTVLIFCMMYSKEIGIINTLFTTMICLVFFISFVLGFSSGHDVTESEYSRCKNRNKEASFRKIQLIFLLCCILNIIISIVNVFSFYPSVKIAVDYIFSPGKAYEYVKHLRYNGIDNGNIELNSSIGRILTICTFSKYIVFSFLCLYWKDFGFVNKVIGIISCAIYLMQSFLMGAMINIAVMVFSVIPLFLRGKEKKSFKKKILIILIAVVFFVCLCFFLGNRFVDTESGFWNVVSRGFNEMMFYVSHGYVGLTYTLELPYVSTMGQTTFYGLSRKLNSLLGISSTWGSSYLVRSQEVSGWNALSVWSTVFPWFASDFSFLLIPIIMFLIGKIGRYLWIDFLTTRNPFAFLMIGQFFVFSFMIPANNQLFHTWANAIGTIIMICMYIISKVKIE